MQSEDSGREHDRSEKGREVVSSWLESQRDYSAKADVPRNSSRSSYRSTSSYPDEFQQVCAPTGISRSSTPSGLIRVDIEGGYISVLPIPVPPTSVGTNTNLPGYVQQVVTPTDRSSASTPSGVHKVDVENGYIPGPEEPISRDQSSMEAANLEKGNPGRIAPSSTSLKDLENNTNVSEAERIIEVQKRAEKLREIARAEEKRFRQEAFAADAKDPRAVGKRKTWEKEGAQKRLDETRE